jgi:hypothetical protein
VRGQGKILPAIAGSNCHPKISATLGSIALKTYPLSPLQRNSQAKIINNIKST